MLHECTFSVLTVLSAVFCMDFWTEVPLSLMEIEIAGSSFKARFMSWKCNSPRKLMPQVCDLNHSFLAVSEYRIFKDNMSKFPRDIHYNGSHVIICCAGVNMKSFSLHK